MGKMIKHDGTNTNRIYDGAKVRMKEGYGSGTKYFTCHLTKGFCMIADTKKDAYNGMGYIHSVYDIDKFEEIA